MHEPDAKAGGFWAATFAVAATYGYFLLFAEFAFLELVRGVLPGENALRPVMWALGAGGIAGSFGALWRFESTGLRVRLQGSYAACAAAAGLALIARTPVMAIVAAAAIGLALGWNTVTLAAGLRALLPPGRLGWGVGCGTGAAYALCNVPLVFGAAPAVQVAISAGLAVVAALVAGRLQPVWREAAAPRSSAVGRWVGVFLALVWLDSAAFYIIQHTTALRDGTWAGSTRLWGNVGVHLAAALLAGRALDRGWSRAVALGAWLALALACLALGAKHPHPAAGFLYAGGVSLYSSALVFFAAAAGRPWIAAVTFALAGWVGSALGIGMAENLHHVPAGFLLASGLGLALALSPWRRGAAVAGLVICLAPTSPGQENADLVARGREVFIAEGCMHCHSQYVRAGVEADVVRWGPAHPLEDLGRGAPPLPGNRRQGPDLTNVGNRRSPDWNRLHLTAPRAISPGSRMPSYAHLFAGDGRGEALVAYLASLGAGTEEARWGATQAWQPAAATVAIAPAEAARLFAENCAACHGPAGRGDGPLAAQLRPPPPDWARDEWRRVPGGDETGLARLIKFGAPGTAMAGHEAFTDAEMLGLARHVKLLHK